MPRNLTSKQEAFAQLVASGSKHVDAYRQAYSVKPTASAKSVWAHAYDLTQNGLVSVRIEELSAAAEAGLAKRQAWTKDSLTDEATENLRLSREYKQMGSANGSLELIGRATGLLNDKQQSGAPPVTQIIINYAPGVKPPEQIVEATKYRELPMEGEDGDS